MKPALISVNDFALMVGIGRTKVYELIREGAVESVHIGRRRLISRKSARNYAESLRQRGEGK